MGIFLLWFQAILILIPLDMSPGEDPDMWDGTTNEIWLQETVWRNRALVDTYGQVLHLKQLQ